jgi:hypothetical protein
MSTPQQQQNNEWENPEEVEVIGGPIALSQEVRAEVDTQITTAKRYPRSIRTFKQQAMEMATFDEETAEGCFYSLPRGGKPIEGPSARLAEIVLSAWGNVRADAKVVAVGDKDLTAEAMTWDLEKNVAIRVQVKRRITDKFGKRFSDDMIVVTGNAACSIALRNSVFKVIPMVYTKAIYHEARRVAIGDVQTLASKRALMVQHFQKMGVTDKQIFAVVGKENIEEIGLDELATLKGMATAIKDGDVSVDEAFAVNGNGSAEDLKNKTQANADALKQKLNKTDETKTTEPAAGADEPPKIDEVIINEAETDVEKTGKADAFSASAADQELSIKDQVAQTVYRLQKNHGVKDAELKTLLPEGVKKFSDLTDEQAADVLPSVQQLLENKQAG